MNKTLKKKWIDALRSKAYKQGVGNLKTSNNKFCCLGVLCDLISPDRWKSVNTRFYSYSVGDSQSSCQLPKKLACAIHLSIDTQCTLIGMNDAGESFNKIANWIKKNVKEDGSNAK